MTKKALLIGINRYQMPGGDLRGCVNDVKNMAAALNKYYDFPKSRIKKLTDLRATTKNMKKEISGLLRGAKPGDVLYLHYSGHGSNVPDKNGDEADHRDEILCPADLDWKNPLLDDWLRDRLDAVPSGVNLTVIMDCCHSGSITRAFEPPDAPVKNRFLASPWDLVAVESSRSLKGSLRSKLAARRKKAKPRKNVTKLEIPEVLITGCRSTQTSADAYIGGSYHGALTHSLVSEIKAKRGKLTYQDLHAGAMKRIVKGRYDQRPQLEGLKENLKRPFLEPF